MPPKAEHAGDEPDGDGLAEQGGEHEDHGGEEPRGGADLGVPAAVEGRPRGGGERQRRPDRRPQPPVQRRGRVAEVVDAHVRRGRQAQPAHREGPAAGRRRHGPLCLGSRHGREVSEGDPGLAMLMRLEGRRRRHNSSRSFLPLHPERPGRPTINGLHASNPRSGRIAH